MQLRRGLDVRNASPVAENIVTNLPVGAVAGRRSYNAHWVEALLLAFIILIAIVGLALVALRPSAAVNCVSASWPSTLRAREKWNQSTQKGVGILVKLKAAAPTNATLPRDLAWFEARIAELEK